MVKIIQLYPLQKLYIDFFIKSNPHIRDLTYQEQIQMLIDGGISSNHIWKPHLPKNQWDCELVVPNFGTAQQAWWRENETDPMPQNECVLAARQIEKMNPDILYIMVPTRPYDSGFIRQYLKKRPTMVMGWRSALWYGADLREFDLILGDSALSLKEAPELGASQAHMIHPFAPESIAECVKGVEPEYDLLFAGSCDWVHEFRIRILDMLARKSEENEFTLGLFINSGQPEKLPEAIIRKSKPSLWGNDVYKALRKGKICLNIYGHPPNLDGFNMRLIEGLAAGAFMLNQRVDGIEKYFEPDKEIVLFDNEKDLLEKITYYLAHPKEREEIALRGQERCLREHSPHIRAQEFTDIVMSAYQELQHEKEHISTSCPPGKPKVVMLSSRDSGGAGIAAYRLHRGLVEADVDSKMIVLNKDHKEDNTVGLLLLSQNGQSLEPWPSFCLAMQSMQAELRDFPGRRTDIDLFSSTSSMVDFRDLRGFLQQADVINLHWCAGLFDYKNAPEVLAGRKIVWTLHDMNAFTGGCHYAGDCDKYQLEEGCHNCPQLGNGPYDLAQKIWQTKKETFQKLDITVVTPSRWLGDCASKSSIFKGCDVRVIPYGLPLQTFHPEDKSVLRREMGLPVDEKIILFGCESLKNHRKGFDLLLKAIDNLPKHFKDMDKVSVAVFGEGNIPDNLPLKVHLLGKLNSEGSIARAYAAADLYVISTREDNLPNTVLEAFACGTPVAGFKIGGLPDMVVNESVGILVDAFDCDQLAGAIARILLNDQINYASNCRARAEEFYALDKQAENYCQLFNAITQSSGFYAAPMNRNNLKGVMKHYREIGLDEQDVDLLDKLFAGHSADITLQELWAAMDRVWDMYGCNNDNPEAEDLNKFYSHPIWALNGWFGEHDQESLKYREGLSGWIAQNSPAAGIKKVLDYGGGWGSVDRLLASKIPQTQIDIFEPYPNPVASKLVGEFANLRFVDKPEAPYDCVIALDVLEHSCDMLKSLEEIISLTRKDGLVITGNCFEPCIKCHLPRNMHFKGSFVQFAEKMGLKKLGQVLYFEVFQKQVDIELSSQDWGMLREMEEMSNRQFGGKPYRHLLESSSEEAVPSPLLQDDQRNCDYLISAIISTYKSEKHIKACLEDLANQSLYAKDQLEIVVINSNSPQGEDAIIKEFSASHPHVKYIKTEERETLYKAWNRGVQAASGKYLTNANTDDRHVPKALEIMVQTLEDNPDCSLAYADIAVTEDDNVIIGSSTVKCLYCWPEYSRDLFFVNCYAGPQPVWRASIHEKYGMFDPEMKSAGDYDMWLRMASADEKFIHVPQILGLMYNNVQGVGLGDGELTAQETHLARQRSWKSEWGEMPPPRGVPVVKPLAPGTNPYGMHTLNHPQAQVRAVQSQDSGGEISVQKINLLADSLAKNPQDTDSLALLRKIRAGFSQHILSLDDQSLAATLQGQILPLVEAIGNSPLTYFSLEDEEQRNVEQVIGYFNSDIDSLMQMKLLLIICQYTYAFRTGIEPAKLPLSSRLQTQVLDYIFATPPVFTLPGDADKYARHIEAATFMIRDMVRKNPNDALTVSCSDYFLRRENYINFYFNTMNLKGAYTARAEILSYSLRRKGYPLDWQFSNTVDKDKKIRIGFLNTHFTPQTETYTSIPHFEYLDRGRFEVLLYSFSDTGHPLSEYAKSRADKYTHLPQDISQAMQVLRSDDLDILVIGTNVTAVTNLATLLACCRLARIQLINNSSPVTSGMPFADGYIGGSLVTASGDEEYYSEKLYHINGTAHCFAYEIDKSPAKVTLDRDRINVGASDVVFVSAANFYKIIPEMRQVWFKIMQQVPNSYLLLHPFNPNWSNRYPVKIFNHQLISEMQEHGLSSQRLIISENALPGREDVVNFCRLGDVYLDTFPFAGVNSTYDPLAAGVPTVVYDGDQFRSRMAGSLLRELDLGELITTTEKSYISKAVDLANSPTLRNTISQKIQQQMSQNPIFLDRRAYGKEVEKVYLQAWEDYLAQSFK